LKRPGRERHFPGSARSAVAKALAADLPAANRYFDMAILADLNALAVDAFDFAGARDGKRHQQGKKDIDLYLPTQKLCYNFKS